MTPQERYDRACTKSRAMNETNDCVLLALCVLCKKPYTTVHRVAAEHGRRPRQGMVCYERTFDRMLYAMGHTFHPVDMANQRRLRGRKRITVAEAPLWLPGNQLFTLTPSHALAIVEGQVIDWTRGKRHTVEAAYEVMRIPK